MRQPFQATKNNLFRFFGTIFGPALLSIGHPDSIQGSTNQMISNPRQILHTSSTNKHDRMLLEVMSHSRDVSGDFNASCQTNSGNFPQCGIRLLGCCGIYPQAHPTPLRTTIQRRTFAFEFWGLPPFSDQLIYGRHKCLTCNNLRLY